MRRRINLVVAQGRERGTSAGGGGRRGDFIVTGHGEFLALDPFEGIAIVMPAQFLTVRAG